MKNSDQFEFIFYAILKAGCVVVPVNFRLTAREVSYILDDSDSVMVFADEELTEVTTKATEGNNRLRLQVIVGTNKQAGQILLSEFRSSNVQNPTLGVFESDDAEILYTSGTTGLPKGVVLDHHRILHVGIGTIMMFKMGHDDNLLHIAPLFHSAQFASGKVLKY